MGWVKSSLKIYLKIRGNRNTNISANIIYTNDFLVNDEVQEGPISFTLKPPTLLLFLTLFFFILSIAL